PVDTVLIMRHHLCSAFPYTTLFRSLLCSAIISDTLMFRSPTCTPLDENTARKLAGLAGVEGENLAQEMFNAGSNLKGKSAKEIRSEEHTSELQSSFEIVFRLLLEKK